MRVLFIPIGTLTVLLVMVVFIMVLILIQCPSSLVKITEVDKEIYAEELLYQSQLTNQDLIAHLFQLVPRGNVIYCDSAEPARIQDIRRAGINALPADKDVKAGIMFLKAEIVYSSGSANPSKRSKATNS